jgi:hypothetical protein
LLTENTHKEHRKKVGKEMSLTTNPAYLSVVELGFDVQRLHDNELEELPEREFLPQRVFVGYGASQSKRKKNH